MTLKSRITAIWIGYCCELITRNTLNRLAPSVLNHFKSARRMICTFKVPETAALVSLSSISARTSSSDDTLAYPSIAWGPLCSLEPSAASSGILFRPLRPRKLPATMDASTCQKVENRPENKARSINYNSIEAGPAASRSAKQCIGPHVWKNDGGADRSGTELENPMLRFQTTSGRVKAPTEIPRPGPKYFTKAIIERK